MKVLYVEDSNYPLFSAHAWVSAGSINDPEGAAGCAHMIEHLAFCGTVDNPEPSMALFNRIGCFAGAFTLKEYTLFSVTGPAEHTVKALNMLLDIVFNPALDENEFNREKEVVLNEAAQGKLNPESRNINSVWGLAFQDSPYGRPVIGYADDIRRMSCDCVREFHSTYYSPDNIMLIMAGSLPMDVVIKAVEGFTLRYTFSGNYKNNCSLKIPNIKNECTLVERWPGLKKPYISIGLVTDPVTPERYFTMKALEHAFYNQRMSPLKICGKSIAVSEAGLQWQFLRGMSILTISMYVDPDVLYLYSAESDNVFSLDLAAISPTELDQIKIAMERDHLLRNYRPRDYTHTIGLFDFLGCNDILHGYKNYLKNVNTNDIGDLALQGITGSMVSITLTEG